MFSLYYRNKFFLAALTLGTVILHFFIYGEPLYFHNVNGVEQTQITRANYTFLVTRHQVDGSGNYTIYTVTKFDSYSRTSHYKKEYTTCGGIKLQFNRLTFYKPHDFHCGWLTTPIDNIIHGPQTEVLELTPFQP